MSPHTKDHPLIRHLRGREKTLEPFGWSPDDTQWVAMVCLNSGVFTRGQYSAFFHAHHSRVARLVQSLVDLKLAVEEPIPGISPPNRPARSCRITYKPIYQALGISNVRYRGDGPEPHAYLRRLLSLDYVIEHPQLEWLPTEAEKVEFCTHYGVPPSLLPRRLYGGAAGEVIRYFPLKLPIGAAPAAGGPVCTFVYIDPGHGTPTGLRHWGQDHAHIWSIFRKGGLKIHVAAVVLNPVAGVRAQHMLTGWAQDREGVRIDTFEVWRSRRIVSKLTRAHTSAHAFRARLSRISDAAGA